jgi:hypothetical protein
MPSMVKVLIDVEISFKASFAKGRKSGEVPELLLLVHSLKLGSAVTKAIIL